CVLDRRASNVYVYPPSLHDALPISKVGPPVVDGWTRESTKVGEITGSATPRPSPIPWVRVVLPAPKSPRATTRSPARSTAASRRSEEHTSELQSRFDLVCRLLLEKK